MLEQDFLIFETNTCVLQLVSVLSYGVFPAKNHVLCQITNSRKIPPSARFILPGAVFHRDGQSSNRTTDLAIYNKVKKQKKETNFFGKKQLMALYFIHQSVIFKSTLGKVHERFLSQKRRMVLTIYLFSWVRLTNIQFILLIFSDSLPFTQQNIPHTKKVLL